jgi:serine/threonine-protein kinase
VALTTFCPVCTVSFTVPEGRCPFCQGELRPRADASLIGTTLNERYFVVEEIGVGAHCKVFRARQRNTNRDVAIKVLHHTLVDNPRVVSRFYQEGEAVSRLSHPNIVTLFEFDHTEDGLLFQVLEYLDGAMLSALVSRDRPMEARRALTLAVQICGALSVAHAHGIVHRDLKPSNLMVVQQGDAELIKVIDFGLAKILDPSRGRMITLAGDFCGTAAYMSPEQIRCDPLDQRSDIYSLGALLFELLSGRPPFVTQSIAATAIQHLKSPVPLLREVDPAFASAPELDQLLTRALAKDPSARFEDAASLKRALQAALGALAASAHELAATGDSNDLLGEPMSPDAIDDDGVERTVPSITIPALPDEESDDEAAGEESVAAAHRSFDQQDTIPVSIPAQRLAPDAVPASDDDEGPAPRAPDKPDPDPT